MEPNAPAATTEPEARTLIASDRVVGTEVRRPDGSKIGRIERLMLDKASGRVAYAVMSFGGFLGIGESYHPLPWEVLTYDPAQGGYVVNLSREQLEGAPRYSASETPDWTDPGYGRRIRDYYGVPVGTMGP